LGAGDALVLFSDGVTEAEDAEGREFGEEGLIQCLGEAPFDSAAELLERVRDALGKFCGSAPPRDDLTLMVVVAR
jgi:sigma-B regulation protein RsbU (phosphoserine phosphatase)